MYLFISILNIAPRYNHFRVPVWICITKSLGPLIIFVIKQEIFLVDFVKQPVMVLPTVGCRKRRSDRKYAGEINWKGMRLNTTSLCVGRRGRRFLSSFFSIKWKESSKGIPVTLIRRRELNMPDWRGCDAGLDHGPWPSDSDFKN